MKLKTIYNAAVKGKFILPAFLILAFSLIWGGQFVYGQQTNGSLEANNKMPDAPFGKNENYRIGPGDVIDIIVVKNETLSQTGVQVNNKGGIQLRMIDEEGDFPAACLTERELADRIRDKYKMYLLRPYVNVAVKEFNSNPVSVIGAVQKPGSFQLKRPMRLLELLTLVNGPTETAGRTLQIVRDPNIAHCEQKTLVTSTENEILSFTVAKTLQGDDEANPFVRPGDVVRMLEADKVPQAYIIGSVKTPGTIELKESVTLTQAIAMAGGVIEKSNIEKITIARKVPGSLETTPIAVNLKQIRERKASDIVLEPNDIVEVPGPKRNFLKDALNTILRSAPIPFGIPF